jgi:uroporphyrinogen decarboxylase
MITPELYQSRFMKAARREPVDATPVWIMRQAGRYLPEYMAVRSKVTFIDLCKRPELAAEVTLTAQSVLGVDAAILFADLLPMLEPMGANLEYAKGEGPIIHNPIREAADVARLRELNDVESLGFVFDAVKQIRQQLPIDIPLLGFAGAPFTLASYLIEGGGSRHYVRTKSLMYNHPAEWRDLMEKLSRSLIKYLARQIESGCQAVQLFDSWAGCLSPVDYQTYALPYSKLILDAITPLAPVIHFVHGNNALLPLQRAAGGSVMGIDWRINLKDAWDIVGHDVAVQGNLDPVALMANIPTLKEMAEGVLKSVAGRPGHIFNLGHGVFPEVPPDHVKALVKIVHEFPVSN